MKNILNLKQDQSWLSGSGNVILGVPNQVTVTLHGKDGGGRRMSCPSVWKGTVLTSLLHVTIKRRKKCWKLIFFLSALCDTEIYTKKQHCEWKWNPVNNLLVSSKLEENNPHTFLYSMGKEYSNPTRPSVKRYFK